MSKELFFWIVYLISFFGWGWSVYNPSEPLWYRRAGGNLVMWLLIAILGWAVFGPPIR